MKIVTFIVLVMLLAPCWSATYYVSTSGSDTKNGLSEANAWATLAHAASNSGSGDILLLKRGDLFRETASLSGGNRQVGAYGNGNDPLPIISGSIPIAHWTIHTGSIYVADVNQAVENLYVDNKLVRIARYPNTGWLRTKSWTENNDGTNTILFTESLTAHPSNTDDYWNGSNIRWHRHSWWFETRTILDYTASYGRLDLSDKSLIHVMPGNMDGWGFYLDNKFEELDSPGEWFYNATQAKVYLWAPGGVNPTSLLVEGTVLETGLSVSNAIVENIWFRHQKDYGLRFGSRSTIKNCRFTGIGGEGGGRALFGTWGCGGSLVESNEFRDNLNLAISWNEDPNNGLSSTIQHNVLVNSGTVDGYGGQGPWHAAGIIISNASNLHIQYNQIDGTGYAGIILGRDSNFVEYNLINNAMATLNDGAGVYTNCNKSTIRYNIITNCLGGMESSGPWANLAHGIWPEFLQDFRESVIENNTVSCCGGYGLFLPNNFDCSIKNNVFYNNGRAGIELSGKLTNSSTGRTENLPQNNTITGNVCYAADPDQDAILFRPEYDYGTLSGNYICNPYTDQPIGQWQEGGWSIYPKTITEWQGTYSWADQQAKTDPFKRPSGLPKSNAYAIGRLVVNTDSTAQNLPLGPAAYVDLDGNSVSGSINLQPFSSVVLVQSDSTPVHLPPVISTDQIPDVYVFSRPGYPVEVLFTLLQASHVSLKVYDIQGILIDALVNQAFLPGSHKWSNLDLPASGIYFLRFSINDNTSTTVPFIVSR